MLNIIKSDLYRMFKAKSFYVMQILIFLYNIIVVVAMDNESIGTFISWISINNIPLLTGIFMSIFTYSDYKNGYIKNIAGIVPSKVHLLLSKMVIAVIYILISFAVYIFSGLLFSLIFAKHGFTYDASFIQILKCLGVHFVLHFAMAMITITLITLTRSNALACTISILAPTSTLFSIAYGITTVLKVYKIIPSSFDISPFFISPYFSRIDYLSGSEIILKALVVAVVYIAVLTAISVYAIKKKDIK